MQTMEAETKTATAPKPEVKKWQASDIGPIQTKRFNTAWSKLHSEHSCHRELSGVIGGEEYSSSFQSMFGGGRRDDVLKVQAEIGDRYGWTVSKANLTAILAEITAALPALVASRPTKDNRITKEQDEQQRAESKAYDQERKAKQAEKAQAVAKRVQELKAQYPWAVPAEGLSRHAHAAANMREELRRAYPGIAFQVRSESYSGGDAVRVKWEMGPTMEEVRKISQRYVNGHFDGMTDSHEYDNSVDGEAQQVVLGRVRHASDTREIPLCYREATGKLLCEMQKIDFDLKARGLFGDDGSFDTVEDHAYRLLAETSFPPGAVITGIEDKTDGCGRMPYRLLFRADIAQGSTNTPPATSSAGVEVRYNKEHNGVEVSFPSKPSAQVIADIKGSGFRWSPRSKVWYKRYGSYAWARAHTIAGIDPAPPCPTSSGNSDPAGGMVQANEDAGQDEIARQIGA